MMIQRELRQNPDLRRQLRPVETLLGGTAAYTLPAALVAAKERFERVQAAIAQANGAVPPEPYAAAQQLADGVQDGEFPADLGGRQREAEEAHERANAHLQVLRLVETRLGSELRMAFVNDAEEIVVEHLRPALDETLEEAGKMAPKLKGLTTPTALLHSGDDGALKAWRKLGDDLLPRYRAIRQAYDLVYRGALRDELDYSDADMPPDLLTYRNFDQLPRQHGRVVAPTTEAEAMVWLVTESGGVRPEPWLPLPDEIGAALEAARERVRDQQVSGWQAAQKRTARTKAREEAEQEQRDKATKSPWRPRPVAR